MKCLAAGHKDLNNSIMMRLERPIFAVGTAS